MTWRITSNQQVVLEALKKTGTWYPGCGWFYKDLLTTVKILDALCSKGLVITYNDKLLYELRK